MKLTDQQLQQYLAAMAKERGFDDARTGKLIGLVTGDGDLTLTRAELKEILEPIVEHPLARHAEFSSRMDQYNTRYAALEKWRTETAEPTVQKAEQRASELEKTVNAFKARFGDLDDVTDMGGGKGVTATGEVVDMNKVNSLLEADRKQRSQEFWEYQLDSDRITRSHFERFGKLPDMSKLISRIGAAANDPVQPRRLTLDDVYREEYGQEVDKYNKEQEDKRIEAEVDKRDKARRARASAPKTGVDADGVFWAHHKDQPPPSASATPPASVNESDLAAAFTSDFESTLAAANEPAAATG